MDAKCAREVTKAKILLFGPVSSGKSSFVNSVDTIDKGRISNIHLALTDANCVTGEVQCYEATNHLKGGSFNLVDIMGLHGAGTKGLRLDDALSVAKGYASAGYAFSSDTPLTEKQHKYYRAHPELKDEAHCVVFVVDSKLLDNKQFTEELKTKMADFKKETRKQNRRFVVLLTKIDRVCSEVKKDTSKVFHSRKIESVVQEAHRIFGIPISNMFPVRNYADEVELNMHMDILILMALRKMVYCAVDRLENINQQVSETDTKSRH